MTSAEFVKRFRNPDQRAKMFIDLDLKEPDINLVIPVPEFEPFNEIHFVGYVKVRAGAWFVKDGKGRRVPISAFRLFADGVKTYEDWISNLPDKRIMSKMRAFKSLFVKSFEGAVMPESFSN